MKGFRFMTENNRWILPLVVMVLTFVFTGTVSAEDGGGM